jgi:hypothetical protein
VHLFTLVHLNIWNFVINIVKEILEKGISIHDNNMAYRRACKCFMQQTPESVWLECEDDQSPPSTIMIKNKRIYTSMPPYVFMAWYLSTGMTLF